MVCRYTELGVHKTTELLKMKMGEWALAEKWVLAQEHIEFTLLSVIMYKITENYLQLL